MSLCVSGYSAMPLSVYGYQTMPLSVSGYPAMPLSVSSYQTMSVCTWLPNHVCDIEYLPDTNNNSYLLLSHTIIYLDSHCTLHYCSFENRSTSCVAFFANQSINQSVPCLFKKTKEKSLLVQTLQYMKFDHSIFLQLFLKTVCDWFKSG